MQQLRQVISFFSKQLHDPTVLWWIWYISFIYLDHLYQIVVTPLLYLFPFALTGLVQSSNPEISERYRVKTLWFTSMIRGSTCKFSSWHSASVRLPVRSMAWMGVTKSGLFTSNHSSSSHMKLMMFSWGETEHKVTVEELADAAGRVNKHLLTASACFLTVQSTTFTSGQPEWVSLTTLTCSSGGAYSRSSTARGQQFCKLLSQNSLISCRL